MGIFYNNYEKLKQQNTDELLKLSKKSQRVILDMREYITSFGVSLFELEMSVKELVGMAAEAEVRGADFKEELGMPEEEFCKTMVDGAVKRSFIDQLMIFVRNAMLWFWIKNTLWFVFTVGQVPVEVSIWDLFFVVVCADMSNNLTGFFKRKFLYKASKKKYFISLTIAIVLYLVVCFNFDGIYLFQGDSWQDYIMLTALTALAFLGNNFYWNKISEKYNWE